MNKIIVLSAPSGSGKTTIIKHIINMFPILTFSISCTTRNPRFYEKNGIDYYFINKKNFFNKILNKKFAEWEEVYPGIFYGTLKNEIKNILVSKKNIIFDLDVKGALNIKKLYPNNTMTIFIKTSSLFELKNRLKNRKTESIKDIKIRIDKIKNEFFYSSKFDFIIKNDNLNNAKKQIIKIITNFLNKK